MTLVRRTVLLESDLLAEALRQVGARNLSRLLNAALHTHLQSLQRQGVEELEAEFTIEYGPVSSEIVTWVATIAWPN